MYRIMREKWTSWAVTGLVACHFGWGLIHTKSSKQKLSTKFQLIMKSLEPENTSHFVYGLLYM